MSLVNKMLRDLDARRVGEGERAALPAAVTPLAARNEPVRLLPLLLFAAVALAAAAGGMVWYGAQPGESPLPAAPRIPAPVPVAQIPVAPAPVVSAATPAVPAAAATDNSAVTEAVTNAAPASLRMADELLVAPAAVVVPPAKPAAAAPKPAEPSPAKPKSSDIATPKLPPAVSGKAAPVAVESRIDKKERMPSAAERAESEYRRAVLAQRQGHADQAVAGYRAALESYPEHAAARSSLSALLIEAKRFDEADDLLRKGTELPSVRLASTLALARLKVERNQVPAALELLQKNAASGERSAEYQGFTGALLNRAGRLTEAIEHYQAATRLSPGEGRWWAGLGIALDAAGRAPEAREAYQKARSLPGLPVDLARHIEQRLR